MKKAFTMVELIFVIVIIGVLSAIAIPKLNATREDAVVSKMLHNGKVLLSDFESYYMAKGNAVWRNGTIRELTGVTLGTDCQTEVQDTTSITPNTFVLCNGNVVCLSFETTNEGILIISDGSSNSDQVCQGVKGAANYSNRTYQLGGSSISP